MKKVSFALVVALLLVTTATAHAESQTWTENLGSVRRVTVTTERIIPSETYSNLASLEASGAVGVGLTDLPAKADTTALTPVNTFFNESRLFLQGFGDVWKATSGLGDQTNLQSAEAKYDFWKDAGIYDKYTPRQVTFLNKVVFPAVGLARGLSLSGSVVAAAYGIAALAGLSFLPVFAVAISLVAGFTAYKWYQVKHKGADVAGKDTPNKFYEVGANGMSGLATGAAAVAKYLNGLGPGEAVAGEAVAAETAGEAAAGGLEAAGSIALPIVTAAAGIYGTVVNSYGAVKLLNAWGIPEMSAEHTGRSFAPASRDQTITGSQDYTVDYRITK